MRFPALALALAVSLAVPALARAQATDPAEDPRNLSWVEKGVLAVGGGGLSADEVAYLASQGFGAVADFRSEHDDGADVIAANHLDYLYLPVDHATDMNVTEIHRFLAWADAEAAAGKPIYVHCTNGWHRAGAFAIAWRMHRAGQSMDDAAAREIALRPGTEVRAAGALLRYQAELKGGDPLTVALESGAARPPAGGSMPVTALVLADGKPRAGADVHLYTETRRVDAHATTGADGRATFDFPAPSDATFMDYLSARASASGASTSCGSSASSAAACGFVDGADTVEVFYGIDVAAPASLAVNAWDAGHGAIGIHLAKSGGPLHARVVATTSDGWGAFDSTPNLDGRLPAPPQGGTVTVTVSSWGAPEASTTTRIAAMQTAPPPPADSKTSSPTTQPAAPPEREPPAASSGEPVSAAPPASAAPTSGAPAASGLPVPSSASAPGVSDRDVILAGIVGIVALAVAAGVWRATRMRARR